MNVCSMQNTMSHPQSPYHSKQAVQHLATGQRCKHRSDEHHCDTEKHSPPDRETGTVHLRETSRQTHSQCQAIVPLLLQRKQRFWTQVLPVNILMDLKDKKLMCRVGWVGAGMHLNTLKHKKGPINKGQVRLMRGGPSATDREHVSCGTKLHEHHLIVSGYLAVVCLACPAAV